MPFNEGDRVQSADGSRLGTITEHDEDDFVLPYYVEWDGDGFGDGRWVKPSEVAAPTPAADASPREALVTRAKELLTGTDHTGADVVALAAFLAGE